MGRPTRRRGDLVAMAAAAVLAVSVATLTFVQRATAAEPVTAPKVAEPVVDRCAGVPLSIVNAGISGNHMTTAGLTSVTAIGPSALDRFDVDVLAVAGVTDVVVYEGINDIYMAAPGVDIASKVIAGYQALIDRARAAGLRVIGATITPASMTEAKEAPRLAVNEWIRTSGAFDAVLDFDAVVRDPAAPARLLPAWDAGMAHMTDAGYGALAAAVPLDIFQGTGCARR